MDNFEISYKTDIITGDTIVDPEGCNSICFENLGTKTAFILDNMPLDPMKIREFTNEANCVINQKFRVSYRTAYQRATDLNTQQILVTKVYSKRI